MPSARESPQKEDSRRARNPFSVFRPAFLCALLGVVATVGALSGCGSGSSAGDVPHNYINNEKVERAIEQSVRVQRHREVVASCPPFVRIKKGASFECQAATKRGPATFRVTIKDDRGNVHYETPSAKRVR